MRRAAAQALRLRAWALGVLTGAPAAAPPHAGADAWELFLAVERCAHPLRRALSSAGVMEALADPARAALERHGIPEAMKSLALRLEAAAVAGMLAERGWTGIVLKGGAAVLDGACEVGMFDLDLLVRPEHARPLVEAMDRAGYRKEWDDVDPDTPGKHEMAVRIREGGIMVEIHFDLAPRLEGDLFAGAVPLPVAPLLRLAPAENLWHVLIHGTLHHPDRRGVLRDVMVATAGVRWCSPAELAEVERRCAAHPRGHVPARMLAMARDFAAGRAADPFARDAAAGYLLRLHTRAHEPSEARWLALSRTVFALVEGRGEMGTLWYGEPESAIFRGYVGDSALDRRLPLAAAVIRSAWRSANLVAAFPAARWIARASAELAADPPAF